MKVLIYSLLLLTYIQPADGFFFDFVHGVFCRFLPRLFQCEDKFDYALLYQFKLHKNLFGGTKDRAGNAIYPTYSIPGGWSTSQVNVLKAVTVTGQTFDLEIIEELIAWDNIYWDIVANETGLDDVNLESFEATLVFASINGNNTFLGLLVKVPSAKSGTVTTLAFPIDEALFYGYSVTPPRPPESLVELCPNFFVDTLTPYLCTNTNEKVVVEETCKNRAESVYTNTSAAAQREYDAAIAVARNKYKTVTTAILVNKVRDYTIAALTCARLATLQAIASCMIRYVAVIEGPGLVAKPAATEAFALATDSARSRFQQSVTSICNVAKETAASCIDCTPCDLTQFGVECCAVSDCGSSSSEIVCTSNKCIAKGNPRFTLSWFGDGTSLFNP